MVVARLLFFYPLSLLFLFLWSWNFFFFFFFFLFPTGSHGCIVTFQPLNNRRGALFQHAHTSGRFWSLSHVIFSSFFLFFGCVQNSFLFFGGWANAVTYTHTKRCVCCCIASSQPFFCSWSRGDLILPSCPNSSAKNEKPKKRRWPTFSHANETKRFFSSWQLSDVGIFIFFPGFGR